MTDSDSDTVADKCKYFSYLTLRVTARQALWLLALLTFFIKWDAKVHQEQFIKLMWDAKLNQRQVPI